MIEPARHVERICERYIRRARVTAVTADAWQLWLLSGLWPLLWKAKRAHIVSQQHAGSDFIWNLVDGQAVVIDGRWSGRMGVHRAALVRRMVDVSAALKVRS